MRVLFYGGTYAQVFFKGHLHLLDEAGVEYDLVEPGTPEALAEVSKGHDAVITFFPLREEAVNSLADSVKAIIVTSIGYDNIDMEAASKRGIMVCNIPDYCIEEVALHSVTLILCALRNICQYDRTIRSGGWKDRSMLCGRAHHRMSTLTMGFLGFGGIGRMVCKQMSGFGVKFVAYDPYVPASVFEEMGVQRVETKDELYAVSDIIGVYLILTDETYHLINEEAIAKMKDDVILVNTARGAIIDLDSVKKGLKSGKIGAVGFDTWEQEPIPADDPILQEDNATITSHCAYFSIEAAIDLRVKCLTTAINVCKGEIPYNCVNKKALGL